MIDMVVCKLSVPVKYGTENKETEFVEIRCPAYSNVGQRKYRRGLKAMLSSIIVAESEKTNGNEAQTQAGQEIPTFTAGQILLTVSASLGEEDFPKAVEHFCAHAKEFVLLGGEEFVKSGTLDRMDPDDVDMIFATFIANFIMPSLLTSLLGSE